MNISLELIIGILGLILVALLYWAIKSTLKNKFYKNKYSKIISINEEVEKSKIEKKSIDIDIEKLRGSYKEKKIIFDNLVKEAAIYDETIELAELGFYKPHFDFDTSEVYKDKINSVKYKQKQMIRNKEAIYCEIEWTVEGSKAKGRTMTNRNIRLTARAFNNECDAAISKVRWDNALRLEQRLEKVFNAINKLNVSNRIEISTHYLELKLKELRLSHEYKEKKQQEKEEQAEIRRQMREETKLQQEMDKAFKEEEKYQKLLAKVMEDAEKVTGVKLEKLKEKMESLEKELAEAQAKSERAKSMAEQTKIGHVYVISNVGSFGEDVYKIGMTRRLEPLDRVRELGDASVPFLFDVHAMIFAEDAPSLEKSLHKAFDFNRLNLVNNRKEFFKTTLQEIKQETNKISPDAEFIETAEARQYRESQALRAQREEEKLKTDTLKEFPESI
ncbi:MAG: DUF4041 domain-containing protein [Planctomycetia bacterium]|nr:DUF4041 domain-containing protein [Planctomycetia bacterium]